MAQRNYPCDNYLVVYFGDSEVEMNEVRCCLLCWWYVFQAVIAELHTTV